MKRFGLAAAAAVAVALVAMPAHGADKAGPAPETAIPGLSVSPMSCYVQGLGGSAINTARASDGESIASVSASGWLLSVGGGCDIKMGRVVIGALARYEVPVDQDDSLFRVEGSYMAAARAGYLINSGLMIYGLAGMSAADWRVDIESLDAHGLILGGGLEIMLTPQTSLTAEYTQARYGSWNDSGVEVKPGAHSARVGISYRFGTLFGE